MSLPEVSKIIGDEWKKLNDEAKEVSTYDRLTLSLEMEGPGRVQEARLQD